MKSGSERLKSGHRQTDQFLPTHESHYAPKKIRRLHCCMQCLRRSLQLLRRFLPTRNRRDHDGRLHCAGPGLRPTVCHGIRRDGP